MSLPPRFPVTRAEISRVVTAFYARIRKDSELAPIFAVHVDDWRAHEEKITDFWANAILHERAYQGNPMMKHLNAGNVEPGHFRQWLLLFDEVVSRELPEETAIAWSTLTHRIGRGLQYGLQDYKGEIPAL